MRIETMMKMQQQQQQQQRPFYGRLSVTTQVSRYQKKHSPTHHPDHHPIFISFFHLPRSIASSLFKLRAWQSFCTTSVKVLFGLPLGLEPSTSYSIHFFTQSVSSFHSTCPYHRNLFCCSINIISSIPRMMKIIHVILIMSIGCGVLEFGAWVLAVVVSVCLSVCLSQVNVLLKRLNLGSRKQRHTVAQVL